jgi:uncharacterized membrane protein
MFTTGDDFLAMASRALMRAGSFVCHQMPERSPFLIGAQMPLCWRCTGILIGTIAFLLWLFTMRRLPSFWLSLALASLMLVDLAAAIVGIYRGANSVRFVTGALWGAFSLSAMLNMAGFVVGAWQERNATRQAHY